LPSSQREQAFVTLSFAWALTRASFTTQGFAARLPATPSLVILTDESIELSGQQTQKPVHGHCAESRMAGIQMTHVPYKSGPAAMTDLIGGQVNMFCADFAVMLPQVKAGKIRGLAVTSTQRSKAIPELPTVNEALGLKDHELIAYFAVFARAGTPADIVNKLNAAVNAAATEKTILERFSALGFETAWLTSTILTARRQLSWPVEAGNELNSLLALAGLSYWCGHGLRCPSAVTLYIHLQYRGVMHQAVHCRQRHGRIHKHLAPL
jgi:hypothetical protein